MALSFPLYPHTNKETNIAKCQLLVGFDIKIKKP